MNEICLDGRGVEGRSWAFDHEGILTWSEDSASDVNVFQAMVVSFITRGAVTSTFFVGIVPWLSGVFGVALLPLVAIGIACLDRI